MYLDSAIVEQNLPQHTFFFIKLLYPSIIKENQEVGKRKHKCHLCQILR